MIYRLPLPMYKRKSKSVRCVRNETKVSVSENGKVFRAIIEGDCHPERIHIDADPYRTQLERRCDYAIRICPMSPKTFFFVELKGDDVRYAVEQLAYTVEKLQSLFEPYAVREACAIVSSRTMKPAVNTRIQICLARLKKYKFNLKCKTRQLIAGVGRDGGVSYMD